jgi:hypothetical protein
MCQWTHRSPAPGTTRYIGRHDAVLRMGHSCGLRKRSRYPRLFARSSMKHKLPAAAPLPKVWIAQQTVYLLPPVSMQPHRLQSSGLRLSPSVS